tara:strand:+ start:647 stop:1837 length:1191 start_codon:yes stop_codon:yes gene_type:complete
MAKQIHIGYFADKQAAVDAVAAKKAEVEAAIAQKLRAVAQELEHTRGLPLRPAHAADAEPETAYYGEKVYGGRGSGSGEAKEFGPTRLVRVADKSAPGGFVFHPCCIATLDSGAPCTSVASIDGKHCMRHGGGFKAGEARGNGFCTHCKTMGLAPKRRPQHGGNGLCPACQTHLEKEAAENGYQGPTTSRRWEEVVFEQLLPLITYADGTPFPLDQRDERRGGGLGTSVNVRKRRRECDTTSNRYPDCLWVLRDKRGRAVMALSVEVDEHSHTDRNPECETGKIDDTFQAVQERCKHEGVATGSAGRIDGYMVPLVFIRFNPNAYDKAKVKLDDRVKVLADLINSYAHMDVEAIAKLQTHAPILHVMYYHSKEGGKHLAHYASKAVATGWEYTVHC